jgi:geranylgeranyl diphosphate synthase type I
MAIDPAGAVNPADGSGGSDLAALIAATGAPEQLELMIRERVAEGVGAITEAPIQPDAVDALTALAVNATQRPA